METTGTYPDVVELLARLVRVDTTNPPGEEAACIAIIDDLLQQAGIQTTLLEKEPGRPNLIARLKGTGDAPPLLLQGHVDVVTTSGQSWTHPPFAAVIDEGYMWGRGTLDMKGAVAMMVTAFVRAHAERTSLPGDVILCVLADEEAGGDAGARYLVEKHPEQFEDVRYAIGEFGGFTFYAGGKRFYPIMVAEKQVCWMKATLRGPGGHGSRPHRGGIGAVGRLGKMLSTLDHQRLPVHITPVVEQLITQLASEMEDDSRQIISDLLDPDKTDGLLDAGGEYLAMFDPMLHNTVSPNIIHGGTKINVIPSEISVELDGRLLPGYTPDDMIAELRDLIGDEVELEVLRHDPGPATTDMRLYGMLGDVLRNLDPDGIPLPFLITGVTDARHFAQLGIQTYGFTPIQLPPGFDFAATIHAADERIPVDGLRFGAEAMYQALKGFGV